MGMGVTPCATCLIDPTRGNHMDNIENENPIPSQPQQTQNKLLSQKIFHKSFSNKTRTQSLSNLHLHNVTPAKTDVEMPTSADDEQWRTVPERKRQRESPEINKTLKQKKLDTYWLSQPIPTSNRFSDLIDDSQIAQTNDTVVKPVKPPPLYVDRVSNIQPLLKMLDEVAADNYEVKVLRNDQVRIQPVSTETCKKIVKNLQEKDTEFYTYRPKQDRWFKVVLKNLHPSTDAEEIKAELEMQGHKVTNIWNVKQRNTKKALPLHFVELEPNSNNKQIYNIKSLLHCRVDFEPPRPKRDIPQCGNCQQYGHTKKYCFRKPKCIKCAGDHASSKCERKERSDSVKCILCDGNHPANYKGCAVYKELQKIKYPPQLVKHRQTTRPVHQTGDKETTTEQKDQRSYKQATMSDKILQPPLPTNKQGPNESIDLQTSNNDTKMIMNTMSQLLQQLTSMTNLLMEIMTKLSSSIH